MLKLTIAALLPLTLLFSSCDSGPVSTTTFTDSVRAVCASMRRECDNKPAIEIDVFMRNADNNKKWVDTIIVCCEQAADFVDSVKSLKKQVEEKNFNGKEKTAAGVTMFTYKATNSDFEGVVFKTSNAHFSMDSDRLKNFFSDIDDAFRKCCI
jgi:hypothetical protein